MMIGHSLGRNWQKIVLLVAGITLLTVSAVQAADSGKGSWQDNWQRTLSEAKKEGKVTFYSDWAPSVRTALTPAFGNKYGINLEFIPFGRSAEMVARVQTENNAGLYSADLFGAGTTTLIAMMKPAGLLGTMEPMLILPEVKDPRNWRDGKFPFFDKDKTTIGMLAARQLFILYNTDQIRRGEITGYKDLLKPAYKGRITMDDPSIGGLGQLLFTHLALDLWNLEEAKEFLKQLVKQQNAVIQRDKRVPIESVARGKFALALTPSPATLLEFINAGAPIDVVKGACLATGNGNLAAPKKPAHPNAAKVLANWLLSKEAQGIYVPKIGSPSLRTDVSTKGVHPIFLFEPGDKLFMDDEEHTLFREKNKNIVKQIIDDAIR